MKTITIFGSKKQTKEGREFIVYCTHLENKETGEEEYFTVKFRDGVEKPKNNPCNIDIEKENISIQTKKEKYTDKETGEEKEISKKILWINGYNESAEPYIDHSTDSYL